MNIDPAIIRLNDVVRPYARIVLVANSTEAILDAGDIPGSTETLYVFYNDARRVLPKRFKGESILFLRSGKNGPSVVRRGRLPDICDRFEPPNLKAIVNLCIHECEMPTDLQSHNELPIDVLDLQGYFAHRYPDGKLPSSGYATAIWFSEMWPDKTIQIRGFNALRSAKWKVFDIHDWAFEQTALRIAVTFGIISIAGTPDRLLSRMTALQAQFPQAELASILTVHSEVLSDRLEHANSLIDQLWSATRVSRGLRRLLKFRR